MKIITTLGIFLLSFQWMIGQSFLENPFQTHYLNNTSRYASISFMGNSYYDGIGRAFLLSEMPSSVITGYSAAFVPKGAYNPLFGNITMRTKAGNYPVELMIQGSQQGEGQAQLASRLYKRKKGVWEMNNIVDGYQYQRNLDRNEDGFQDLQNKRRLVAIHSNSFTRGRFQTTLLAHYINSDATGGDVDFDKATHYLSDTLYGLGHDVKNFGFGWNNNINLSKTGSSTTRRLNVNINGLEHSATHFYGQKGLENTEQFLNSNITYSQKMLLSDFSMGIMYRYQNIQSSAFGLSTLEAAAPFDIEINRWSAVAAYNSFFGAALQFKSGVRVDYEEEQLEVFPRLQLDFAIPQSRESSDDLGYLSFFAAREKRFAFLQNEYQAYLNSGRDYFFREQNAVYDEWYDRGWSAGASFTFEPVEFEMPGLWAYTYLYNAKILWRSALLEERTDATLLPVISPSGGLVRFSENDALEVHHWMELALSFRIQRFYTHFNYRINNIGVGNVDLVPNTSMVITSKYDFNQGISTSLRCIFQGKQELNDGTTSPYNYRLDWRNDFGLERISSNYFTDNATFYFGINNIFYRRQKDLVQNASMPFSATFDGSQIWGNTVGFQIYGGMKFNLRW